MGLSNAAALGDPAFADAIAPLRAGRV